MDFITDLISLVLEGLTSMGETSVKNMKSIARERGVDPYQSEKFRDFEKSVNKSRRQTDNLKKKFDKYNEH